MSETTLNQQIAEALGWRGIESYTYWLDDEEGAHEVTAMRGTPPQPNTYHRIPDFEHSLDAVAAACKEHCIMLKLDFETNYVELVHYPDCVNGITYAGNAAADTIERAAAHALLQWAQHQEQP